MNCEDREFLDKFNFSQGGKGRVGAEVEYFLADGEGENFCPVPDSPAFLDGVDSSWGYELSACQVEYHTQPVYVPEELLRELVRGREFGSARALAIGRVLVAREVAPESMTLEVYVNDRRYVDLAAKLPTHVLSAACRVAGTHLHMGVGCVEEALEVYNALALKYQDFLEMGDHSEGERIQLYKVMAPRFEPPQYGSVAEFCEVARSQGFEKDPRDCYHFVRLNPKGTVEVRAFGIPEDPAETLLWIKAMRDVVS